MRIPDAQLEQIRANAEAGHPESQFLLSQICQQDGDVSGMIRWLREASANGVPDAFTALEHCCEQGEKWVVTKWFREEATQYANF